MADTVGNPESWAEVRLELLGMFNEFREKLMEEIYRTSLKPLQADVKDLQGKYEDLLQQHSSCTAIVNEIADAKLIRRVQVTENEIENVKGSISTVTKVLIGVGLASFTSTLTLIILLLTHQVNVG